MMNVQDKSLFLSSLTSEISVVEEILEYTKNNFFKAISDSTTFRTHDEVYIASWEQYYMEAKQRGVYETLKSHLIQFQFDIVKGVSSTSAYRDATLKGKFTTGMKNARGLQLNKPDSLQLKIHQSVAGKIPVLTVLDQKDFVTIIQALSHKNEPSKIPDAMGAAIIIGINNWSRIHTLRKEWQTKNPFQSWNTEFRTNILPNKSLYQDKIIVLSTKPYSGVTADQMNMLGNDWLQKSVQIRLEHECAHLFTLKYFGSMANNMHDELIADYMGITSVTGRFNSDWFLRFIGLEKYPQYREGGRLENYLGKKGLSEKAFKLLTILMKNAAENISEFDKLLGVIKTPGDQIRRIICLCELDLISIASSNGTQNLLEKYKAEIRKSIVS